MIPGIMPVIAGATGLAPPLRTYIASYGDSANLSTYTFTNCNIGTASSDRFVVVACHHESGGTFTGCTIDGVAATLLAVANAGQAVALYGLAVPSGTTATIAFTLSSSSTFGVIGIWSVTGLQSTTPTDIIQKVQDAATVSDVIDVSADGIVIAATTMGSASTTTINWTAGATKDYQTPPPSGENCNTSGASYQATAAEINRTITASVASQGTGSEGLVAVALR